MDCSDRAGLTSLYLSGELDAARSAGFRAHLESCPRCAREIADAADIDARLCRELHGEDLCSAELETKILSAVKRASFRRSIGIAASAAALAAMFALGFWVRATPAAAKLLASAAQDHHREVVDRERRIWVADVADVAPLAARAGITAELAA